MKISLKIYFTLLSIAFWSQLVAQTIVINEFLAANDSTTVWVDENGEHDDWVELHNLTDQAIDLSGYYLSDSKVDFQKWQIPAGVAIGAQGYLIIWADDDDEQGDLHTNFKLNKAGDELTLSSPSLEVLDSITFGTQEPNVSLARIPNGTGNFEQRAPTFNANNDFPSAVTDIRMNELRLFPNPSNGLVRIESEHKFTSIKVYDQSGKPVTVNFSKQEDDSATIWFDFTNFPGGFYIIELRSSDQVFLQKAVIQR